MRRGSEGRAASVRGNSWSGFGGHSPQNSVIAGWVVVFLLAASGCGGGSSTATDATSASTGSTTSSPTSSQGTTTATARPPAPSSRGLRERLSPSPEATVRVALTTTGVQPQVVCGIYTQKLLEAAYGNRQGCVAAIKSGGGASSVKIVSSKTSGSTATVVAIPSGGPSSGEKLTYSLVKENDKWRLDAVKSNVKVGP